MSARPAAHCGRGGPRAAARRQPAPESKPLTRPDAAGRRAAERRRPARRRDAAAPSRASGIAASRFRPDALNNWSAPQQHELHGDRRPLGAAADGDRSRTSSSRTSIARRRTRSTPARREPPYGYVIPVQRDMTRVGGAGRTSCASQRIEVGQATGEIKVGDGDVPRRLVRHQARPAVRPAREEPARAAGVTPIPNLRTYDDSGWTMGLAMLVDVKEIKDKAILDVPTTPVTEAAAQGQGRRRGHRRPGRRALRLEQHDRASATSCSDVPMKIAEKSFTADGVEFPAGSFVDPAARRPRRGEGGGRAARTDGRGVLTAAPTVPMHDADAPRIAMYSSWSGTQEIGWVRFTLRQVRHPVRPDLQGARSQGEPAGRLRRDPDADADRDAAGGVRSRPPRGPCRT